MSFSNQGRVRGLAATLLLSTFMAATKADVPASTYVGMGTSPKSQDNVTVSINVPDNSTDTLFYHFSAPSSRKWAAFGFGDKMKDALIFVTYASEDGNNVTVSPRLGKGHTMPQHTDDVKVDVLEGSGVINNVFVVNAKCTGCRSWDGGKVDVDSTDQDMIWALGPDGSLKSDDVSASITQHEGHNFFDLNLKDATGIGGVPNVSNTTADSDDFDDGPFGRGHANPGVAFHAFLMVSAFLIVFPAGYLLLRILNKVVIHWAVQTFALLMVCVGTAAGIGISIRQDISPSLNSGHQILGLVILALVITTWVVGFLGHRIYNKTGTPAKIMKGHRVLGPGSILLGIVNTFVGFNFAGNHRGMIIYGVATFFLLLVVGGWTMIRRRQEMRKAPMNTPAAMNFREGQYEPPQGPPPPPLYGEGGIPLQSYSNAPPVYR
ncbi:uncharacterized protein PV06_07998 [Exophiala oligosperma]|uniref:DOMON domain-containing protein n=1 Tax=Exophiala oligosperma TaxID=215243 RepID=A0A0D2BTN8_9EURO|nr:uncharacterized protein PV06_07998 [Exophiala oligosperma]KIW40827.1 hypothetical protein PV06_07998 [Exophiala oligosperma]